MDKKKPYSREYSIISLDPAPPTLMLNDLSMLDHINVNHYIGENYNPIEHVLNQGISEFGENDNRAVSAIRYPELKVEPSNQKNKLIGAKVQCLPGDEYKDKFFVMLSDIMGSDAKIQGAASKSFGKISKTDLTKYVRSMLRRAHTSPFESCEMAFEITIPKSTAIQLLRHRTGSFNEFSTRYAKVASGDYYVPPEKTIVPQSALSKQGRSSSLTEAQQNISVEARSLIQSTMSKSFESYDKMIEMGIAKEVARGVLPLDVYTSLFVKFDLNNLMRFLKLRLDGHAQMEISALAEAMFKLFVVAFPITASAFIDYYFVGSSQKSRIGKYLFDIIPSNSVEESPFKLYSISGPRYNEYNNLFSQKRMLKNFGFYMRNDTKKCIDWVTDYYNFDGNRNKFSIISVTSNYNKTLTQEYNELYSASNLHFDSPDGCCQEFFPAYINNGSSHSNFFMCAEESLESFISEPDDDIIKLNSFGVSSLTFFRNLSSNFTTRKKETEDVFNFAGHDKDLSLLYSDKLLKLLGLCCLNNVKLKNDIKLFMSSELVMATRMMIYLADNFISYDCSGVDIKRYEKAASNNKSTGINLDKLGAVNGFMYRSFVSRILVEVLKIEPNLDPFAFFKFMSFLSENYQKKENPAEIDIERCVKFMKKNDAMFGESEYIDTIIHDSFSNTTINYHYYLEGVSSIRETFLRDIVKLYVNAYNLIVGEMPDFNFDCWKNLPSAVINENSCRDNLHILSLRQAVGSYLDHAHAIGFRYVRDNLEVSYDSIKFSKDFIYDHNNKKAINNEKMQKCLKDFDDNRSKLSTSIFTYLSILFKHNSSNKKNGISDSLYLIKFFGSNIINIFSGFNRGRHNDGTDLVTLFNINLSNSEDHNKLNLVFNNIAKMVAALQPGIEMNDTLMANLYNDAKTISEIGSNIAASTDFLVSGLASRLGSSNVE